MIADPVYDDKKLYKYNKKTLRMDLICLVERYENTSKERLEFVCVQFGLRQYVYSHRRISIEPLIEHIKSVFRIDLFPARRFHTVFAIVLFGFIVLPMVCYNYKTEKSNPRLIKYMFGTG